MEMYQGNFGKERKQHLLDRKENQQAFVGSVLLVAFLCLIYAF